MKGTEIAAFFGVFFTFAGGIYATWRTAKSDSMKNRSDNAAVLLGGWEKFQQKTLEEVDRVRKVCENEIAQLKKEHDEDRALWHQRETEMRDEIDRLKAQVIILIEAQTRKNEQ